MHPNPSLIFTNFRTPASAGLSTTPATAPVESSAAMSRRRFFGTAGALSATLALAGTPARAAEGSSLPSASGDSSKTPAIGAVGQPVAIPGKIAMGSGAPLGGIGTGFLEIRPDGCFHEWQIHNLGSWSAHTRRGQAAAAATTAPNLRFLLRTGKPGGTSPQLRRLYLRSDENDLYSLGYAQDIEAIDYEAWYPMTSLRYRDATLPVQISAVAFSPFLPGNARASATPGFHYVFTLENTSRETVEVSLLSVLDNPIVSGIADRKLSNTLHREGDSTRLLLDSSAQPEDKSDLGSLCLSVIGGEHSWITGTFRQFTLPGMSSWAGKASVINKGSNFHPDQLSCWLWVLLRS